MTGGPLDSFPIEGIYICIALLILLSSEIGFRIAARSRAGQATEAQSSVGQMVAGLLGMLGFVLALSFSMAATQHELRKTNVLEEANAIGTAYLRTDLLDRHRAMEMKRLLREYVDVRLDAAEGKTDLSAALVRSVEIHGLMWAQAASAANARPNTNTALMIQSINDVIDLHERRVTGAIRNRIPGSVWVALLLITTLTMITMGMYVGSAGQRRLGAVLPVSLAFAALVTLVVDLNRPQSGLITVGQQSMVELRRNMGPERNSL